MNNIVKSLFLTICIASITRPIAATTLDESTNNLVEHLFGVFKPTLDKAEYTSQLKASLQKDLDATLKTRESLLESGLTTIHKKATRFPAQGKLHPLDKCWWPMTNTHKMLSYLLANKKKNHTTRVHDLTSYFYRIAGDTCDQMRKSLDPVVSQEEIDLYAKLVEATIASIKTSQPK